MIRKNLNLVWKQDKSRDINPSLGLNLEFLALIDIKW